MRACPRCDYRGSDYGCPSDGTPTLPEAALRPGPKGVVGTVVGERYRLLSVLGSGGMGTVWFAEHVRLRTAVAVKLLRQDESSDPTQLARFEREARSVSQLQHPNVIRVFDYGVHDALGAYIAMEYLEGEDLACLLRRHGALAVPDVLFLAAEVASALALAHARGLVHRDLKPGNIFLADPGTPPRVVKVLDFGIAKAFEMRPETPSLTRTGHVVGSPHYMSPEQASDQPLSPATDLYSLGVVLHECLTGVRPFQATAPVKVLVKHLQEPPPPITGEHIPEDLKALVSALLSKSPLDRPPSAEDVRERIAAIEETRRRAGDREEAGLPLGVPLLAETREAVALDSGDLVFASSTRGERKVVGPRRATRTVKVRERPQPSTVTKTRQSSPPPKPTRSMTPRGDTSAELPATATPRSWRRSLFLMSAALLLVVGVVVGVGFSERGAGKQPNRGRDTGAGYEAAAAPATAPATECRS